MLGLSPFSGEDERAFQLGLLGNVSWVSQKSWGFAWIMTARGVLEDCNPCSSWRVSKIPMPGSPHCRGNITCSSKTYFYNRETGGDNSTGWWRETPYRVWLCPYCVCPWSEPGLRDGWPQAETPTGSVLKLGIWMGVDLCWRLCLHLFGLVVETEVLYHKI